MPKYHIRIEFELETKINFPELDFRGTLDESVVVIDSMPDPQLDRNTICTIKVVKEENHVGD